MQGALRRAAASRRTAVVMVARRFYQHVPEGCVWSFGLLWGHAVSKDCVTWEHLPPAVVPTPGSVDADGAFSGCATLDEDGVPVILYT